MKILLFTSYFPSSTSPIRGNFVFDQAMELRAKGHDVFVILFIPFGCYSLFSKNKSFWNNNPRKDYCYKNIYVKVVKYLPFPRRLGYFLNSFSAYLFFLLKTVFINKSQFHIIISHVPIPSGYVASKISNKYMIPSIVVIHGATVNEVINFGRLEAFIIQRILFKIDSIVCVSNKLKNALLNRYPNDHFDGKIEVIPNGISKEKLSIIKHIPYSNRSNSIVIVGGLFTTKGHEYLFRAYSKLLTSYPQWIIHVIGDGYLRDYLQRLSLDLGIVENVLFHGIMENTKVLQLLNNSKIFALPSYKEGFGISYIEAMLCQVPVIGVISEGISDIIVNGVNGFLVDPKDSINLSITIDMLIRHQRYSEKVGLCGYKTIIDNFMLSDTTELYISLFKKMINRK